MTGSRESRWRSPYPALACAALLLSLWGFVLQCRKASLPEEFAARLAFPVTVGPVVAGDADQLAFLAESWPAGTRLTLRDAADREHVVFLVRAQGPGLLIVTAVSGLFFWSVAFLVFAPRARDPALTPFFWILLLYGLAVMIGGVFGQRALVTPGALFGLLQIVCLALLPPAFLLLTLRFPPPGPQGRRRRAALVTVWTTAVALVLWQAWSYGRYFAAPGPERAARLAAPAAAADAFMLLVVAAGFAVLVRRLRRLTDLRQVRQIRWLLWGFAVGAAPYLLLRTLPQLVGLPAPLPAGADRVLELAVPLAFVFAVVREQFLDIDVVIRRSLLYSALAAAILALAVVPSLVLTWSFGHVRPNAYRLALLCGGLAAGLLYRPLRRRLGALIDRHVFELRGDDATLLATVEAGLARAVTPEDVVTALESAVGGWFGCRQVSLELSSSPHGPAPDLLVRPEASDAPELESADFPAEWSARGFVVACRIVADGARCGWLLIGPRGTRRRYLGRELDLAREVARRGAGVLERLRLIGEKADEARRRRHLDELNRMKSEFLAQAAHDLRTPVTSISWSIRNLLDGLAGAPTDAQREYLTSMGDAAGHLDTLVANLLDISRLERAAIELTLSDFDPAPCVAQAVSSLKPLADAGRVAVVDGVHAAPRVRGNPEKVVEILVNLLDNAVKYSPPGGVVRVAAEAPAAGDSRWTVVVTDEGPGLHAAGDPFGRFTQGEPSPHSSRKGFGLGLYIVRQYVQLMDGEVTGDNAPDGGARFTLRLPLAPAAGEGG